MTKACAHTSYLLGSVAYLMLRFAPICFLGLWFTQPVGATPMTLKDTLRYALDHSPTLDTAKQQELAGELEMKNARAALLPSLDATTTNGLLHTSPLSGTDPWGSSLNVTLTENLYDNGVTLTAYRVAQVNRQIAVLGQLQARWKLCLTVVQQFYKYSLAAKLSAVKDQQLGLYQKQFRFVQDQYKQGMKPRKDFLRFKSQAQRSEIDTRQARIDVERALVDVRNTIGVPPTEAQVDGLAFEMFEPEISPTDVPQVPPPVANVIDYRVADLTRSLAPYDVQLAKRNYYPRISLGVGANYGNNNYIHSGVPFSTTQSNGWNVLLTLSYNFWDWGILSRKVEIAERNRDIAENTFRQAALDARSEVNQLMLDLAQIKENYKLVRDLLSSEEESFESTKRDYREGKIQPYDFILSLNDLLDARVRFFTSQYGLAEAQARYQYYYGNLYEKLSLE